MRERKERMAEEGRKRGGREIHRRPRGKRRRKEHVIARRAWLEKENVLSIARPPSWKLTVTLSDIHVPTLFARA